MVYADHLKERYSSGRGWALGCALAATTWLGSAEASAHSAFTHPKCQAGHAQCVERVVSMMDARLRPLAQSCDHDALFALLYLRTTETFQSTHSQLGYDNAAWVVREDALFADYYFKAYDAYHWGIGDVPLAWQIAFEAADQKLVSALGNVLLGVNAHILRDLPYTLYDLHVAGTPIGYDDHLLINLVLAQVDVAAEVAARFDPDFPQESNLDQVIAWREQAWQNYVRLRDAANELERTIVRTQIELEAANSALGILQFTGYPAGQDSSARDAHCQSVQSWSPPGWGWPFWPWP